MSEEVKPFQQQVEEALRDNPHGYNIVDHEHEGVKGKALLCPECQHLTNPSYAITPDLPCWSCGKPMKKQ